MNGYFIAVLPDIKPHVLHLRRECRHLQRSAEVMELIGPPNDVPLCRACLRYHEAMRSTTDALTLWQLSGRPT